MKKQLLLIVSLMCAISAMAVSLPSASYKPYAVSTTSAASYSLSVGTTFVNHSTVGSYKGTCTTQAEWNSADADPCQNCCLNNVYLPCLSETTPDAEKESKTCYKAQEECLNDCSLALNEERNPLDAPTAFLLALIAAYGAIAVYRRKMQQV